jgi:hypothetical protein
MTAFSSFFNGSHTSFPCLKKTVSAFAAGKERLHPFYLMAVQNVHSLSRQAGRAD